MSKDEEALAEVRAAMQGDWKIERRVTFTHGQAVQVFVKKDRNWRKAGPLLFPPDNGTVSDLLQMLGDMTKGGE